MFYVFLCLCRESTFLQNWFKFSCFNFQSPPPPNHDPKLAAPGPPNQLARSAPPPPEPLLDHPPPAVRPSLNPPDHPSKGPPTNN